MYSTVRRSIVYIHLLSQLTINHHLHKQQQQLLKPRLQRFHHPSIMTTSLRRVNGTTFLFSAFFLFIQVCDASSSVSASEAAEAPTATATSSMSSMSSIDPNNKYSINGSINGHGNINGSGNCTTREFFRDNIYVFMIVTIPSLILFACSIGLFFVERAKTRKMQQEAADNDNDADAAEAKYDTVSDDATTSTTSTTKEEQKHRPQQDESLPIIIGISFARPQEDDDDEQDDVALATIRSSSSSFNTSV